MKMIIKLLLIVYKRMIKKQVKMYGYIIIENGVYKYKKKESAGGEYVDILTINDNTVINGILIEVEQEAIKMVNPPIRYKCGKCGQLYVSNSNIYDSLKGCINCYK